MKKKVLIVCMFDSIHAARWLSQFVDQDVEFTLYPSKKFKYIHSKLAGLLEVNNGETFVVAYPIGMSRFIGYIDFLFFEIIARIARKNFRMLYLRKFIKRNKFDFVHALEIQGAGYLCDEAILDKNFRLIITNWGSDIFYFQHLVEHLPRIKSVLNKADLYSAECMRDYGLAVKLGFKGQQLPCIPNGGGLVDGENLDIGTPTSLRKNIVVKAYGGIFGRGGLAIEAVSEVLAVNPDFTAYFYSVTDDLYDQVSLLKSKYGSRIGYSTIKKPISSEALNEIFLNSRVYVGCSISDGISTSFLESLVTGAYPIQTNTSCAGEWIDKGVIASCIDLSEINSEIHRVINLNEELDRASLNNLRFANLQLSQDTIKSEALKFYI